MANSLAVDEQAKSEWQAPEYVSDDLLIQARSFLQAACSLARARHVLDLAAEQEYEIPPGSAVPVSLARHEDFARECGYATYAEMSHFAEPIGDAEDKDWYLTPIHGGHWVIWNDCDCKIEQKFPSYATASKAFSAYRS